MGWWNVTPAGLRVGDEVRVTTMGGQDFLTVEAVDDSVGDGYVRVKLAWPPTYPTESFWDDIPVDEKLRVRR